MEFDFFQPADRSVICCRRLLLSLKTYRDTQDCLENPILSGFRDHMACSKQIYLGGAFLVASRTASRGVYRARRADAARSRSSRRRDPAQGTPVGARSTAQVALPAGPSTTLAASCQGMTLGTGINELPHLASAKLCGIKVYTPGPRAYSLRDHEHHPERNSNSNVAFGSKLR